MQKHMQITAKWSRSKPEVELQYGGRLFSETEVVIYQLSIDYVDEFGLLIYFDLPNTVASKSRKPEVVLSPAAAILKNRHDVISPQ